MAAVPPSATPATPGRPPLTDTPNKWEVLRELATARRAYGLSDRDLSVLQALISFHPNPLLSPGDRGLVVHPSNASICERLNGMPCSTMRRHVARLVAAGVIARRDSPNGKRYVRRIGGAKLAFGFDLSPLARRFTEFCATADTIRAEQEALKGLRETVSLMRRDLANLSEDGAIARPGLAPWDAFQDIARLVARDLRRKLDLAELTQIENRLAEALNAVKAALTNGREVSDAVDCPEMIVDETHEPSINNAQIEQHQQNTDPYIHDLITVRAEDGRSDPPQVTLRQVLDSCTEYKHFADRPIRNWHDLVSVADTLRPMMGIAPSAWEDAKRHMGPEQAAVVILAMLQRFSSLQNPGGYLRALTLKAAEGLFCCRRFLTAKQAEWESSQL